MTCRALWLGPKLPLQPIYLSSSVIYSHHHLVILFRVLGTAQNSLNALSCVILTTTLCHRYYHQFLPLRTYATLPQTCTVLSYHWVFAHAVPVPGTPFPPHLQLPISAWLSMPSSSAFPSRAPSPVPPLNQACSPVFISVALTMLYLTVGYLCRHHSPLPYCAVVKCEDCPSASVWPSPCVGQVWRMQPPPHPCEQLSRKSWAAPAREGHKVATRASHSIWHPSVTFHMMFTNPLTFFP